MLFIGLYKDLSMKKDLTGTKIAATAHGFWMAQLHVSTTVTHWPIIITVAPSLINSWPRQTGIPTSVATKVVLGCSVLYYWASLVAQMVKNLPAMQEIRFDTWLGKIPWRMEWWPTPVLLPEEFHGQRTPAELGALDHIFIPSLYRPPLILSTFILETGDRTIEWETD